MRFPLKFPAPFGGHDPTFADLHQQFLDAYAPGWDTESGTEADAEAGTAALAVTMIYLINRRFGNGFKPGKMTDLLQAYEDACKTFPRTDEHRSVRRRRVAAKLRGVAGNTLADIEAAASKVAGSAFVALVSPAAADVTNYWPGINPGPPGYEFSSDRATVCIHLQQGGISTREYLRIVSDLDRALDGLVPAWMRVEVGTGSGVGTEFICGEGIAGMTII
jgi:hypothetical protein